MTTETPTAARGRPPTTDRRGRLGPRPLAALAYMRERFKRDGKLPTLEEIGVHLGIARQGAWVHVGRLERAGLIERNEMGRYRLKEEQ